jgi:hypothetical protein
MTILCGIFDGPEVEEDNSAESRRPLLPAVV